MGFRRRGVLHLGCRLRMRRQARGSAEPAAGAPRGRHRAARARGRDPGSHLGEMCAEAAVLAGRAEARTPSELPFCWAACGREVPFPTVADGHFLAMPRPATIARRDRLRRYTTSLTANQGSAMRGLAGSFLTYAPSVPRKAPPVPWKSQVRHALSLSGERRSIRHRANAVRPHATPPIRATHKGAATCPA